MALPFPVYLHPIARSSALEIAARHDACLGRLDSVAGVNQDLAPFNSLVAYTS